MFVPSAPALVPDLTGGPVPELAPVRAATEAAVAVLAAAAPRHVLILGAADRPAGYDEASGTAVRAALAAFGGMGRTDGSDRTGRGLPPALALGGWLLDRAGLGARSTAFGVAAAPAGDADLEAWLADRPPVDAVLIVGDGSATRDPEAPGTFHPESHAFDDEVAAVLAAGDGVALAALDLGRAARVRATGGPAWRAAGRLLGSHPVRSDLSYYGSPYGVAYLVAAWTRR